MTESEAQLVATEVSVKLPEDIFIAVAHTFLTADYFVIVAVFDDEGSGYLFRSEIHGAEPVDCTIKAVKEFMEGQDNDI